MTAIEASSVRMQTMADGTLRLTLDIEPRNAQAAFGLFAAPGTPMAIAALKAAKAEPAKADKPKQTLSQWVALRCQEPQFAGFLADVYRTTWESFVTAGDAEEHAAAVVRSLCEVESRAELDTDEAAAELCHNVIRKPYADWLKTNQWSNT